MEIIMRLGTGKRIITPKKPVRLCGYATRRDVFDGVLEDIYLRVHYQEYKNNTVVFIYGDLLWWNSEFVMAARKEAAEAAGLPMDSIFFVASHNHSGPGTGTTFIPQLETMDIDYVDWLKNQVIEAVMEAKGNLEKVTAIRHDGTCDCNVFRRAKDDQGKIAMKPNYQVNADKRLTVVSYQRTDGSIKGFMIHYPCHANLSDGNQVHPDYPGIALGMLDDYYKGSVSLFLQGCTADIRPNSVLGNRFVPCDFEHVKMFAQEFFDSCKHAILSKGIRIGDDIEIRHGKGKIPLTQDFSLKDLEEEAQTDEAVRQWLTKVKEKDLRPYEVMEISKIRFGSQLSIFTFNAEVSQYYAEYARTIDPTAICAGYTNGMIGYICTANQIKEGGYEPVGSARYFALAGTYKEEIETIIHQMIERL
jgi:hypothetical protein